MKPAGAISLVVPSDLSEASLEDALLKSEGPFPEFTLHISEYDKLQAQKLLSGFAGLLSEIVIDKTMQRYEWYIENHVTGKIVHSEGA